MVNFLDSQVVLGIFCSIAAGRYFPNLWKNWGNRFDLTGIVIII